MAFGFGPILAVVGSIGQTTLLGGNLFGYNFAGAQYPQNFITLFALGSPILLATAAVSCFFIVPEVEDEPAREPISSVVGLLVGMPSMLLAIAFVQLADVYSNSLLSLLGYLAAILCTLSLFILSGIVIAVLKLPKDPSLVGVPQNTSL